jgi:septal ring factor EnvC (AmiA/AmiB activator)
MVRTVVFVFVALLMVGSLTGCVNVLDVKKLQGQEKELRKDVAALQTSLKALEGRMGTAEAQLPAVKAEITNFTAQFKTMNASIAKAQGLIVKNLENARDIYKTQFLALEEVLRNLKKTSDTGTSTTPPAK